MRVDPESPPPLCRADDLWIFGYGSLMWRTGFPYVEAARATLTGLARAFCVYSVHHRGTPARPGLVLGLDRGGACHGMAFRVAPEHAAATIAYLRAREQVTGAYRESQRLVRLNDGSGRHVRALCYVVERAHPQYTGPLTAAEQARIIRWARGVSGANVDYLMSTLEHLEALGIREPELMRVRTLLGPVGHGGHHWASLGARPALPHLDHPAAEPARRLTAAARARFMYRTRMR